MAQILFITEGKADVTFLAQYICHLYPGCTLTKDKDEVVSKLNHPNGYTLLFLETTGCDNLVNKLAQFEQVIDQSEAVVVVFDADTSLEDRRQDIEKALNKYEAELKLDIFLFPNDTDNGNLETLLENIINPNNTPIFTCWDSYLNALGGVEQRVISLLNDPNIKKFNRPSTKAKIYSYLSLLTRDKKNSPTETKRDYFDKAHWDLDHQYLDPLKAFLQRLL